LQGKLLTAQESAGIKQTQIDSLTVRLGHLNQMLLEQPSLDETTIAKINADPDRSRTPSIRIDNKNEVSATEFRKTRASIFSGGRRPSAMVDASMLMNDGKSLQVQGAARPKFGVSDTPAQRIRRATEFALVSNRDLICVAGSFVIPIDLFLPPS
jgi:hypothetical protein